MTDGRGRARRGHEAAEPNIQTRALQTLITLYIDYSNLYAVRRAIRSCGRHLLVESSRVESTCSSLLFAHIAGHWPQMRSEESETPRVLRPRTGQPIYCEHRTDRKNRRDPSRSKWHRNSSSRSRAPLYLFLIELSGSRRPARYVALVVSARRLMH